MLSRAKTLREAIAKEAALLLLRGKVSDFSTAKKKASRWYSKRRVKADDMPTASEIQWHIDAIAGRQEAECRSLGWHQILHDLRRLCELLADGSPQIAAIVLNRSIQPGLQILVRCCGDIASIESDLAEVCLECRRVTLDGVNPELQKLIPASSSESLRRLDFATPVILWVNDIESDDRSIDSEFVSIDELDARVSAIIGDGIVDEESTDDGIEQLRFLLEHLEGVTVSPDKHPEGDLLYHGLQTFELGAAKHPYDADFQWACLLHDVGFVIDYHAPHEAAHSVVTACVGERTAKLISALPIGCGFLRGEKLPRAWNNDSDCELLIDLARCDRDGRTPGARVRELDDVLNELNAFEQW